MTLIEIVVVIIVLGILARLAIPSYMIAVEKTKVAEAMSILSAIYRAQIRHKLENGMYSEAFINACNPGLETQCLDVTVPPSQSFEPPSLGCGSDLAYCPISGFSGGEATTASCGGANYGYVALTTRLNTYPNPYILYMLEDGRILCQRVDTGTCDGICSQLGFDALP